VPKSNKKTSKVKKGLDAVKYLEPIPNNSFIRHQILKLFIDNGLDDFQAQILLSIVLHGGQIKPVTLAKDIHCNPSRLELHDGFPSLIDLNLIAMSHTRPKTVMLALKIDELIERLSQRTLVYDQYLEPEKAQDVLIKLDQYAYSVNSEISNNTDEFTKLFDYFDKLKVLTNQIPSLFSLIYYSLVSLWMNEAEALVLSRLITCGGKISKRQFFLEYIKNISIDSLHTTSKISEDDLRKLGYTDSQSIELTRKGNSFFVQTKIYSKLSSEHQFNTIINNLKNYCQSTSMGEKKGTRKFKYFTLIKNLSQIAGSLYQSIMSSKTEFQLELKTLSKAYSNVKLVDEDIFLSSIADPSSTRKRLETDLKYAEEIYLALNHSFFVEDIFLKVFDSDNLHSKLIILAAEEQKEPILKLLATHKSGIQGKRGILAGDKITFLPSDEIPQDVLIGNTLILLYKTGSSMINIHEEISKQNPTEINTIVHDVNHALKSFNDLMDTFRENSTNITMLIKKRGI
jgi:hypothetical protein